MAKVLNYTQIPPASGARLSLLIDNGAPDPQTMRLVLGVLRLANTKSAEKAARQSTVHRARNDALTSQLRSAIRKATLALKAGKQEDASAALAHATPIIDSMVNKGIIHRNKAARHKSRLTKQVRALAAK
jgi:small subunit ribosomal protein S20